MALQRRLVPLSEQERIELAASLAAELLSDEAAPWTSQVCAASGDTSTLMNPPAIE